MGSIPVLCHCRHRTVSRHINRDSLVCEEMWMYREASADLTSRLYLERHLRSRCTGKPSRSEFRVLSEASVYASTIVHIRALCQCRLSPRRSRFSFSLILLSLIPIITRSHMQVILLLKLLKPGDKVRILRVDGRRKHSGRRQTVRPSHRRYDVTCKAKASG